MCSRAVVVVAAAVALLCSGPAYAFRCGSRIVAENMYEAEVRRACGAPTSARHIGHALRNVDVPIRHRNIGWTTGRFPGYGALEEVVVTEYVYNFGPRKLMRRLVFEGGILVSIETLGYGYREK